MLTPLLVPCEDAAAVAAAMQSRAGAFVLDLGDAGAPGDRAGRRRAAADAATRLRGEGRAAIVRVAPLASGLVDADLDAAMAGAPEAVLLPGAVGARDLQHLAAKLAVAEAEHGLRVGRTRIAAAPADTAAGVLALATLPGASPRLLAVVWDAAALAAHLGVSTDASPVRAARDAVLMASAAAGVPALDRGLSSDDLAAACRSARRDGFAGRIARGPDEVAAIAAAFARGVEAPPGSHVGRRSSPPR